MGLLFAPLADGVQTPRLASLAIAGIAAALLACASAPTFSALSAASLFVGVTAITAQISSRRLK
jgi:hypothetical protein